MRVHSARQVFYLWADVLPWVLGAALLAWGFGDVSILMWSGSAVLVAAGLVHFASAHGYAAPRAGRVRMAAYGCWDVPLAFFVRHRGQGLLFYRSFDRVTGELPDEYCVIALPQDIDEQSLKVTGFVAPEDSRLIGFVPVQQLRFDHRGGDYVDAASLSSVCCRQRAS